MTAQNGTTSTDTAPARSSIPSAPPHARDLRTRASARAVLRRAAVIVLILTVSLPLSLATTGAAQTQQPMNPPAGQPGGPPIEPQPGGPLTMSDSTYKVDAIEFLLVPDQFVEYKFYLKAGGTMMFNWKATEPVDVDFHTVPDGKPISASETFMRGTTSSGQGFYRAPYDGLHGWYWKNVGKNRVGIVINASGFFTEARMFSGDPVGEPMEVQDPPPPQ